MACVLHFSILFALSMFAVGRVEYAFNLHLNKTYEEATSYCKSVPSGHLPDDRVNAKALTKLMQKKQVTSVWMGIKMVKHDNWIWTDGDQDTSLGPEQGTGGRVCAGVSTVSQNIQPKSCNYGSNLEGVVCQHEVSLDHCHQHFPHGQCYEAGSVVFSFKCGVDNWYEARFQCQALNASIAKLNTTKKIQHFVKTKNKIPSLSLCNFFWVGLRKEEWMVKHRNEELRELESIRWLPQEPLYGPQCVTFDVHSTSKGWKTTPCTDKHAVICRSSRQEIATTTTANASFTVEDTVPVDSTPDRLGVFIGVGLTISIGILLTTACLAFWYCRKQHEKSDNQHEKEQESSTGPEEGIALLHQQDPSHPSPERKIDDQNTKSTWQGTTYTTELPNQICVMEQNPGQDCPEHKRQEEQGDIHKEMHLDKREQPDEKSEHKSNQGQQELAQTADAEQQNLNGNTLEEVNEVSDKGNNYERMYQSKRHTEEWNKMVKLLQPFSNHWMRIAVISNSSYSQDIKQYFQKRQSPSPFETLLHVENGDKVNKYFELMDILYVTIEKGKTSQQIDKELQVIIVTSTAIPTRYLYTLSESKGIATTASVDTGATGDVAENACVGFLSVLNELQHAHILVAGEKLPTMTDDLVIIRPAPVSRCHGDTEADFYVPLPHLRDLAKSYQFAALYTTLVIMIILRMARRNQRHPMLHKELRNTRRMKQVLLNICAPPGGPDEPKLLDPWRHLTSWESFKAVALQRSSQE